MFQPLSRLFNGRLCWTEVLQDVSENEMRCLDEGNERKGQTGSEGGRRKTGRRGGSAGRSGTGQRRGSRDRKQRGGREEVNTQDEITNMSPAVFLSHRQ